MKKHLLIATILLIAITRASAQKIDSIFFHLYTDSLKKGTNNYINVDGKSSEGRWVPLTSKQLIFTSTGGRFENNDLVLPPDFAEEKVTVYATLRENPSIKKERTIYIKTLPDPELPRPGEEVIRKKTKPRQQLVLAN